MNRLPYFLNSPAENPSIDKYFHDDVMTDAKNVCYVFRNQKNGDIVGLAALCCSGINLDDHDLVELIPAVKIDYFAVSERYQDMDAVPIRTTA